MKRAIRRHHRARLKNNRKNHYWWWSDEQKNMINGIERIWHPKKSPRQLGILVNTPCVCSCFACTNERRKRGMDNRSFKEKEFELAFKEQYIEYLSEVKDERE